MKIWDATQGKVIAERARVANRFLERLRGLIGHPPLKGGEGLWLPHCQGIHTFGIAYPIDVLLLDEKNRVTRCVEEIEPNRFGPVSFLAASVLELPPGTIHQAGISAGDLLTLSHDDEVIKTWGVD